MRYLQTEARRGKILDRNGKVLAIDLRLFTLYAEKSHISDIKRTISTLVDHGLGKMENLESLFQL